MNEIEPNHVKGTLVTVTSDSEARPGRWIGVLTRVNCEKRAAARLCRDGYETYVPVQREVHQWSDRRKEVERRIMPMTVFVRATERDEFWLREQSFIHRLLSLPGSEEERRGLATPIPESEIERLRFILENSDSEVTIVSSIKVGDSVTVASGPLKGLSGTVCGADDKTAAVGVRLDGLGYACVRIGRDSILTQH